MQKKNMQTALIKCIYIYIPNFHIHLNVCIYGCIWPYIPMYAANRCLIGVQDTFTVHLHPRSWCIVHQANVAIVQHYPTSMQRAVAPA